MFAVVGGAGTVDVEAGDDLGDGVVEAQDDLNVAGWVLGDDGNGILGSNGGPDQPLDSFRLENLAQLTPHAKLSP